MNLARLNWLRLGKQIIRDDNLLDCWENCKNLVKVEELQKDVAAFNE